MMNILSALLMIVSFFLADAAFAENRASLEARRTRLNARVHELRLEQDFLLFEQTLSASDSRYLVVRPLAGKGQLKFRQKTLLDFAFQPLSKRVRKGIPKGAYSLAAKQEDREGLKLMFGSALTLRSEPAPRQSPGFSLVLDRPIMSALFSALEKESLLYILQ